MIELFIGNNKQLGNEKALAEAHACTPLLWLAMFTKQDIEQATETDDVVLIHCTRSDGLMRLERAVPFLSGLYPQSTLLHAFATEFTAMLKGEQANFVVLKFHYGIASKERLSVAVEAMEKQALDARYHLPARPMINPFTGEDAIRPEVNLQSTVEVLDFLCGYECDWGEEERGRFIGDPPGES